MAWKKWLALPVLAAVLAACGGGGDDSRCPLPPLVPGESVHVLASVVDPADLDPQGHPKPINAAKLPGGGKVTVTIAGPGQDLVFAGGVPTKFFETTTGYVPFFVRPTTYPVVLRVVARAPNYISSAQTLTITEPGAHRVTVPLISVHAPPAGVTVATGSVSANANGVVASGLTLETAPRAGVGDALKGTTKVVMKAGTRITDKNRQPLSGTIDVLTTYHNNIDVATLDAFPGGLVVGENPDGTAGGGAFISGGFGAIEMAGGRAKYFDPPLEVTIVLPQGTINPFTNAAVKAGDTIPLWSFDPETGAWSALRDPSGAAKPAAVLGDPDTNGNFAVTFQTHHLSYFNLDWVWGQCSSVSFQHRTPGNAALVPANFSQPQLRFSIRRTGEGWAKVFTHGSGQSATTLFNLPHGQEIEVIRLGATGLAAGTAQLFTLARGVCGPIVYTEGTAPPPPPATGTLTVPVTQTCNAGAPNPGPAAGATVTVFGANLAQVAQQVAGSDGTATFLNLVQGTYTVRAELGAASQSQGVTLGATATVPLALSVTCPPPPPPPTGSLTAAVLERCSGSNATPVPVLGATVALLDSGLQSVGSQVTPASGVATFNAREVGAYTVRATHPTTIETKTSAQTIAANAVTSADFVFEIPCPPPPPPPTGTVTATVAIACQQDTSRRRPLEGSGVALFAGTTLVAGPQLTSPTGVAAIGPLLYGTYTAKAWANLAVRPGVTTEVSQSVTLSASAASTELLFLVDCTVTGATGGTGATGITGGTGN